MDYYNEFDPAAARWLQALIDDGLIPDGVVDCRNIKEVEASDLSGFRQCHFFAGIGGWPYALELAGFGGECWTGSCPCQPFSSAGKRKGNADERHLWPEFYRLIRECRPERVFGEQVPGAIGHGWLDGVSADLEAEGYAVGAVVLGAHSVGSPHIRQRLYWVADCVRTGWGRGLSERHEVRDESAAGGGVGPADGLEHATGDGRQQGQAEPGGRSAASGCGAGGLGNASGTGPQERIGDGRVQYRPAIPNPWEAFELASCRDGKARRVEPGTFPLAHGIPGRVAQLRGLGNAIVPQVAAEFVRAYLEIKGG